MALLFKPANGNKAISEAQGSKQKCLGCVRRHQELTCTVCKMVKVASLYSSSMLTYPTDLLACCACQDTAREATHKYARKGWVTCKHCREPMWNPPSVTQLQYCLNCSNRIPRVRDQHTCRSCGVQWLERQMDGSKRQRLCPKCRT
eukprot:879644-Amphidinium_carterae.1